MLNTYCRRCHAAIVSNAHVCPLCGLSRPNSSNLSDNEKDFLANPPVINENFQCIDPAVNAKKPFLFLLPDIYLKYFDSKKEAKKHRISLFFTAISAMMLMASIWLESSFFISFFIMILIFSGSYLVFDTFLLLRAANIKYKACALNYQGGTSPYAVHFKVETVIQNTLKSLQTLLYAFYEKPWEDLANETDVKKQGDSYILAAKALTAKLKKFAGVSLETLTLLWRNNVYAITSFPNVSYEDKITHLNLKLMEAKALILRYCWFRQLEQAHEFLESHLNGKSGRTTDEDRNYVIEGMQLGLYGPLTEPYRGNYDTVPYELPFIMRYYWHQQLPPNSFPEDEIKNKYPETCELFESMGQVRNLISKLEEQKILSMAENAVSHDYKTESEITTEADQIKKFQLYSDYLDIPKFQPNDDELLKQVDRLNAQIKV